MARYGAEIYKSPTKETNLTYNEIGKNSEVFTLGDFLTDGANGLAVAGATDAVIGICAKTQTMTATNETAAKVYPAYNPIDQDYDYLCGCNGNLDALASPGIFYKLAGTTGAMQVDVNSGAQTTSNRVVVCTGVDPLKTGTLTDGLFKVVKVFNLRSDN